MATIAELAVNVVAKTGGMQRGLQQAEGSLTRFSSMAKGIASGIAAAFSIVAVKKLITDFAALGDQLDKMSARTGVAVESLSALGFAAEQSGADIETLEKGFFGLSRAVFDFGRGSAEVTDAFDQLGLSFEEIERLSPERQLMAIADSLQQFENASTRGAIAQKIFGRSGRQLLPLLANGSDGIKELTDEAKELGITLTSEDAKAAAEFTDAMNRLMKSLRAVGTQIAKVITPWLTRLADMFTSLGPMLQKVVVGVGLFGTGLAVAAPAISMMINLVQSLTKAYKALAVAQAASNVIPSKGGGKVGLAAKGARAGAAGGLSGAGGKLALGGLGGGSLLATSGAVLSNPLTWVAAAVGGAGFGVVNDWAKRGFHTISDSERAINRLGARFKGMDMEAVSVSAGGGFRGGTLIRLTKKQGDEQITSNSLLRQQNEILEGIRQQGLRAESNDKPRIGLAAGF